jgi:hypothetical protein
VKQSLAEALIERGILSTNSRIWANCPVLAMGNAPTEAYIPLTVDRIVQEEGTIKFQAVHRSGRKYSIPCSEVDNIDGMAPERLAAAYDIKPDGFLKTAGKKRGRKPKALLNT